MGWGDTKTPILKTVAVIYDFDLQPVGLFMAYSCQPYIKIQTPKLNISPRDLSMNHQRVYNVETPFVKLKFFGYF